MGTSKTEHFTERENRMALLAKAMGHPARIAILEFLAKSNQCMCGDIVGELPLAQPTVSQHLKELKNAGLIKGTIDGTSVCYCIDENGVDALMEYIRNLSAVIKETKSRCC